MRTVVFLGRTGSKDDRRAVPQAREPHVLDVVVPSGARSGKVKALASTAKAVTGPPVTVKAGVAPAAPTTTSPTGAKTTSLKGAAFLDGIDGDPGNVIGVSVPAVRHLLAVHGVSIAHLWVTPDEVTGGTP